MASPNQSRVTPDDLFALLEKEFSFDLDAAADETNAKCEKWLGEQANALIHPWVLKPNPVSYSRSIFCNPPWSNPVPWLEKAYTEAQKSPNAVVVVVLHQTWSAGVTPWLQKASEIRQLLNPRPMFKIPEGYYLCKRKTCKQYFIDHEHWPERGPVCPHCQSDADPQIDSSNSKDVQIIIYRRKVHDTPPLVWFWDWKAEIALNG